MELSTLREQLAQAAQQQNQPEMSALSSKLTRMEAALTLLNEKKQVYDEKEVTLMNQKLALFESNLKELAEEKKLTASNEREEAIRLRLRQMEKKLTHLEHRKSVTLTTALQEKMREVEGQLSQLRVQQASGHVTSTDSRVAQLEKKLEELQNTRITPSMINDEETVLLRNQVKKLEEAMRIAQQKMEAQRTRLEEEREATREKQRREQEAYQKQARMREEAMIQKMAEMEKKMRERAAAPPVAADLLLKRMLEMEERVKQAEKEKQAKFEDMERRVALARSQLEEERETVRRLHSAIQKPAGAASAGGDGDSKNAEIAYLQEQVKKLVAMDQQTSENLNLLISNLNSKVDKLGGSMGATPTKSYAELNERLAVLRDKLFDPDTPERDCETFNIEYEKLISELEQTPEYQREQEELVAKWKKGNEELNKAALVTIRTMLAGLSPQELSTKLSKKPELRLLSLAPEQLLRKHENDWKGITTQSLDETEARALYAAMPAFRKDQFPQTQFVEQLKNRIESEAIKPKTKLPPPIVATKKVTFKKAPPGTGMGFLDELVRRRKLVEG